MEISVGKCCTFVVESRLPSLSSLCLPCKYQAMEGVEGRHQVKISASYLLSQQKREDCLPLCLDVTSLLPGLAINSCISNSQHEGLVPGRDNDTVWATVLTMGYLYQESLALPPRFCSLSQTPLAFYKEKSFALQLSMMLKLMAFTVFVA